MTTDQGPYPAQYPVQFAVEYPDRPLNRLTSFFRIFVIIPIAIVPHRAHLLPLTSAGEPASPPATVLPRSVSPQIPASG